jgi:hypothetical protein
MNTGGAPVTAVLKRGRRRSSRTSRSSSLCRPMPPPTASRRASGGFCHGLYWYIAHPDRVAATCTSPCSSSSPAAGRHHPGALPAPRAAHSPAERRAGDALRALSPPRSQPDAAARAPPAAPGRVSTRRGGNADIQHLGRRHESLQRQRLARLMAASACSAAPPTSSPCRCRCRRMPWRSCCGGWPTRRATQECASAIQYVRPDPVLPQAMLMLGPRSSACEEADAVATSAPASLPRLRLLAVTAANATALAARRPRSPAPRCPICAASRTWQAQPRPTAAARNGRRVRRCQSRRPRSQLSTK